VLRSYGVSGIQRHIRNHIQLGELFHGLIESRKDLFSVLAGPAFALTVITIVPRSRGGAAAANHSDPGHERYLNDFTPDAKAQNTMDANKSTQEVYELVNSKGEIFLTSSVIGGVYAIRVVNGSPSAEEKHMRRAFDILVTATEEVLQRGSGS
jgi:aromatic-L-amino-acid decarboxylase